MDHENGREIIIGYRLLLLAGAILHLKHTTSPSNPT